MAGQVDIIISKKAIEEIKVATDKLELLHREILKVNTAGSKTTMGGVQGNDKIVAEIQAINKLITANKNLTETKKRSVKTIEGTAKALNLEISKLQKEQKELTTSNKSWLQYEMRILKVKGRLKELTSTYSQVSIATRKADKSNKGFFSGLGNIKGILTGGGILFALTKLKDLAMKLFTSVFELAKTFDSLRFALERTSKTLSEAKMNTAFMLKLSSDLGLALVATSTRFIKFAAAARNSGLALKDTQKIFGTMAKAGSVLGLRTDELSGVFLALEQMLSKGKVTTEELRRQLGERLPGAFGIMAASLGVTLPQLDKMLKAGELLSAEVLPGFARAVELAFGLDTVDKVDTLVASQNRLTTSYQNFVKNLTGEGSIIKSFLKGVFESAEAFVKGIDRLFNSEEVANADFLEAGFNKQTEAIRKAASEELELTKKNGEKLKDLKKATVIATQNAVGKLAKDGAHEAVRKASKALLDYQAEIDKVEEKIAKEKYAKTFIEFKEEEELVKEHQKRLAQLELDVRDPSKSDSRTKIRGRRTEEAEKLEKATLRLSEAEGKMNATRLLAEGSVAVDLGEKETKNGIEEISDFRRKALAEELKTFILFNEKKIKEAQAGDKKILDTIKETGQKETLIAKLIEEDKLDIISKSTEQKIKAIKDSAGSEARLTKEQLNAITELRTQQGYQELIVVENTKQEIEKINDNYASRESDFVSKGFEFNQLELDQDIANRKTKLTKDLNDSLSVLGISKKDKINLNKKYTKDVLELETEKTNKSLDLQIAELKGLAALTTATDAQKQSLQATIDVLEGSKVSNKSEETKDEPTRKEQLEMAADYAMKYSQAITDLSGAVFDNQIANIDAEIEATRVKYDELFLLAQGDAEQTRLLRIQENRDLEKLEEKKKKVQRKQAIAEKANALIAIAINTAIAVSKTLATTGFLGIPLIPVLIGLGALQAAAVIAQPLPKFAQGGVMGKDGLAVVGDGGRQEVIRTPDGNISLTPNTDTVVGLQKGTEIFSSVDKFNEQNPSDMSAMLHSSSLLASISLSQKNLDEIMSGQRELDERLLDAMLLNTKAVKNSKSNTFVKTQNIDIKHQIWKSKLLN